LKNVLNHHFISTHCQRGKPSPSWSKKYNKRSKLIKSQNSVCRNHIFNYCIIYIRILHLCCRTCDLIINSTFEKLTNIVEIIWETFFFEGNYLRNLIWGNLKEEMSLIITPVRIWRDVLYRIGICILNSKAAFVTGNLLFVVLFPCSEQGSQRGVFSFSSSFILLLFCIHPAVTFSLSLFAVFVGPSYFRLIYLSDVLIFWC
jgi:hypothetical protein